MGKPTILELLDTVKAGAPDATDAELAERVEAVLKLLEELRGYGSDHLLEQIRRALEGE